MNPEIAVVRQLLAQSPMAPSASLDFAALRAGMEAFAEAAPVVEGSTVVEVTLGGVTGERVAAPDASDSRAMLYLHGGGYAIGSPRTHRALAAQLSAASGATAYVIDYPLAPEHPFPAGLDAAVAAYQALCAQGLKTANIVIVGDSAGGGLALAAALKLRALKAPMPAGLFCMSPWADLSQSGESHRTHAKRDPMIVTESQMQWAALYAGKSPVADPMVSPIRADFSDLPPLLIHVGSEEVLLSDSIAIAARAGEAGVECTLFIAPDMIHVWHAFFPLLTAARTAIADAGLWIKAKTDG
jgi:acetyl esterase/lipase